MKPTQLGVIHGRFQIVHKGHMEYLLAGKSLCNHLYIGITNPDPGLTKENINDKKRSLDSSNPLNYYQRLGMIEVAMMEAGISDRDFSIVPFPINYPEYIKHYVPLNATFFVTIYDQWGEHKLKTLKALGLSTNVMWRRKMSERFTTGNEVRNYIREGKSWKKLVPDGVYKYIIENNLIEQIKTS